MRALSPHLEDAATFSYLFVAIVLLTTLDLLTLGH